VAETGAAYQELTARLDTNWIDEWMKQESNAMRNRGEALQIYNVSSPKGNTHPYMFPDRILTDKVPTLADVRLKLSEKEIRHRNLSGTVSAVTEGLAIEGAQ
jgi:hypothetical protein